MRKSMERNGSPAAVTVRPPGELRDQIDQQLSSRVIHIPRNTWILEAVVEKLQREQMRQERSNGTR